MACCLQSSISTSAASLRPPLLKVSDSPRPRSPPGLGPFILVGTDVDLLQRERAAASSAARAPLARLQTTMKNRRDRKSTRLNSSHLGISYAVFCLKQK